MPGTPASHIPTRLYLFLLGQRPGNSTPYPGYLIQTADGANILIDSGFPAESYRTAGPGEQGELFDPEDHIVRQLARIGLAPRGVTTVISTHFDWDHAGCHDAFPDAEFVAQRAHYDWARAAGPGGRCAGIRHHWDHPSLRYRVVDGDTELRPGITLLETGGHVPGHQSVLVRLPNSGPMLLAIDAIPAAAYADAATRPISQFDMDEAGVRASTAKLADVIRREEVRLTIYGHDAVQWATLRLAPEYYD